MRISFVSFLFIFLFMQLVFAVAVHGQDMTTDKVTVTLKDQSLETAIKQIEQQSTFVFFYRKSDVRPFNRLTLSPEGRTVQETLRLLLQNTFLTFRQLNGHILIERSPEEEPYDIRGRVIGTDQQPIVSATIKITTTNDAIVLASAASDTGGHFKVNVSGKGKYLLKISAVGMDSIAVALTLADNRLVILTDIVLPGKSTLLQEVKITSKKPYIEQKIDRTVVNVSALISNTGSNALEALGRAPGVLVDENGRITFKGKSGVVVLIDDRPTYLSGDNLANYLKSLSASQLDQIELMSNPPAKYDASGNAGLINIRTKKSTAKGFNGGLTISADKAAYWRTFESLNLNYHTDKVNIFATGGFNFQNNYRLLNVSREYFDATGNLSSVYQEDALFHSVIYNPNLKFGMDYMVSPKTTIGFVLTGSLSPGHVNNPVNSTISDGAGKPDSTVLANNHTQNKFNTGGINLNYSHQYPSPGQSLSVDLDYIKYHTNANQSFLNTSYDANGKLSTAENITDQLPNDINIYAAKTDYVQPLSKTAKLEAGLKSSYVHTDNAANYFNIIDDVPAVDNNRTNQFLYKENINAAYISFSGDFKRFSVKGGLRAENTNVNAHQLGNAVSPDSTFSKGYTNLFPTGYLSYKLDTGGHHVINLSYGRRIDRPYYQDLNPFVTIIDKYSYFEGNSFLRPQFSGNYELSYNYKSMFSVTFDYSRTSDLQSEVDSQRGDIFISQTLNIGESRHKAVNIYFAINPAKWWNFNVFTTVFNNSYKSQLPGTFIDNDHTQYFASLNNEFDLSGGWSVELDASHISRLVFAQFVHDPRSQINTGIQKKVLNNKGTLRLVIRDIFRQNFSSGYITNIPGVNATYYNDNANRAAAFSFSYNFGSQGNSRRNRDAQSAESEQHRVKN